MEIPEQLKDQKIILVRKNEKKPVELDWGNKGCSADDLKIKNHDGNLGVLTGYGLVVIDADDKGFAKEVLLKLPKTFTVLSGSGNGVHYYFKSDINKKIIFEKNGKHVGELQAKGQFVVTPNSIHPSGGEYKVIQDLPIARIDDNDVEILSDYIKNRNKKDNWKEGDRKIICPFHEDKEASLHIYEDEGRFYCHGCGARGSLSVLDEDIKNLKKKETKGGTLYYIPKKEEEKVDAIGLDVVSYSQLKDMNVPGQEWYVNGWIPKGSIGLLGGKRSTMKTFLAEDLAFSLIDGGLWLGKFETKKANVLFIDEENGMSVIKARSELFKNKNNININFLFFSNIKLDNPMYIKRLKNYFDNNPTDLVIVDSFSRTSSACDENDAKAVSNFFTDFIRPLAEKYKQTWLFIHHLRKGIGEKRPSDDMDEFRGSSDLVNYADFILLINRPKGSNDKIILRNPKCRVAQEQEAKVIEINWEGGLKMTCIGDVEESLTADEDCANFIMDWVVDEEKSRFLTKEAKALASHDKKFSEATVGRALKLLLIDGRLTKPKDGPKKGIYCAPSTQGQVSLEGA